MKKNVEMLIFIVVILGLNGQASGWCSNSHASLTQTAISNSVINEYLQNQLGVQQGLEQILILDQSVIPPAERIPSNQFEDRIASIVPSNSTVLDLLESGSRLEDIPNPRAKHHFHDPNRNIGLDNKTDHPEWREYGPAYWTNYKFDFTGESALDWAINGTSDKIPTENLETWDLARKRFCNAVTYPNKPDRDRNMSLALLSLGSVLHLLEDMGVPAHARNDFLFGHYKNWFTAFVMRWGNDLEDYVEDRVISNGKQSPWSGTGPVVFDKLAKYFDADVYDSNYLGDGQWPPEDLWGLAECTNYQFLSLSTVFGCSDTKNKSCRNF